jgi:HEAT repeat protein
LRKKRWLVALGVVLLVVLLVPWGFPVTVDVPLGYLRHEAFYAGKPTRYWARGFQPEHAWGLSAPTEDAGKTLRQGGTAALPVLYQLLEHPNPRVRWEALLTLDLMDPPVDIPVPVLTAALEKETDTSSQEILTRHLLKAGKPATVAALSGVLEKQPDAIARLWAINKLSELGPAAEPAVPALQKELQDPAPMMRIHAARVLWELKQPPEPLVAVLGELFGTDEQIDGYILDTLATMGPAAQPVVPAVAKYLETDKEHRIEAVRFLGNLGPNAAPAVPALIALLKDSQFRQWPAVVVALGKIGPAAHEALPALRTALVSRQASMWSSIVVLGDSAPNYLVVVPLIRRIERSLLPAQARIAKQIQEAITKISGESATKAGPTRS